MPNRHKSVVVTCGLSDSKLRGKLAGLISSSSIDRIVLVRKRPLYAGKIVNRNPPAWVAHSLILFELWRFFVMLSLGFRREARAFVGIQAQMHGIVAVLVGVICGTKTVLWLIGSDLSIYSASGVFAPAVRFSMRRADTVFVMGESSRQKLEDVSGRTQRVYVQQVVFERVQSDFLSMPAKKWDLIYIGNFVDVKDPLAAVSVFSRLHEKMPAARFCMLGDGELRHAVLKRVVSCDLGTAVDVLGQRPDPLKYLAQSKILVITSRSEGLPSVLVEASSLGVPAISFSVGEISALSEQYEGMRVVPAGCIDSFVEECIRILSDESAYQKASASVFQFAAEHCEAWSLARHQHIWEKALDSE